MRKSIPQNISQYEKISIKNKVSRKTVIHIAADNYLRSTTRYIMTISASNLIEDKIPKYNSENIKLGTDGSQKLVGMMQDALGKDFDFYPMHRNLLASTDDTTLFISTGEISTHSKDNEILASSVHDNKTQIYYKK